MKDQLQTGTDQGFSWMTKPIAQRVALVTEGARCIGKAVAIGVEMDDAAAIGDVNGNN